jgi:hypothetical protein
VCGSEVAFPFLPWSSLKILESCSGVGHGSRRNFSVAGYVEKNTSALIRYS